VVLPIVEWLRACSKFFKDIILKKESVNDYDKNRQNHFDLV
jgi:hypothetical protein